MSPLKFNYRILFLIVFLFQSFIAHASPNELAQPPEEETVSKSDLALLTNPLKEFSKRKAALDRLLIAPTNEVFDAMIQILKNQKDFLPMKHEVANSFITKHDHVVMRELERMAFYKMDHDDITREICLEIVWRAASESDKQRLAEEFLHLAKNQSEPHALRRAAIGYLGNAKILFDEDKYWADEISRNKKESTAVRTAALNYIEYVGLDTLPDLMAEIIKDESENIEIREITILKAARLPFESLKSDLESILLNQSDEFEIRKMCLNMLLNYGFKTDAQSVLYGLLETEKNEKMKALIKSSLENLGM